MIPEFPGHVFLSYVREDSSRVDALQAQLEDTSLNVWRDVKDLWPGEHWRVKLRSAIQEGALAFVPCFSEATASRGTSTMFEELNWAAEEYRRRNPDRAWIFPVFFDNVDPPHLDLGSGRTLESLQWTKLYADWGNELVRLIEPIRRLLPATTTAHELRRILPIVKIVRPDHPPGVLTYHSTSWDAHLFYNTRWEGDIRDKIVASAVGVFRVDEQDIEVYVGAGRPLKVTKRSEDPAMRGQLVEYRYWVQPTIVRNLPESLGTRGSY